MALQQVEITEPLIPTEKIRNVRLVVRESTFQPGGPNAAIFQSNGADLELDNVELITDAVRPDLAWDRSKPQTGFNWNTAGIRFQDTQNVRLANLYVRGFPSGGIVGFGGAVDFSALRIHDCFHGINFGLADDRIEGTIHDVITWDQWGMPTKQHPEIADRESKYRGRNVGGDGMALNSFSGTITDCRTVGEAFGGFKLVSPLDVWVENCDSSTFMVQGTPERPASGTYVTSCRFYRTLNDWKGKDTAMNHVQISDSVRDVVFQGCEIIGAPGYLGHGIQFATQAHGRLYGCRIEGPRGEWQAASGSEIVGQQVHVVEDGSSVNEDLYRVNQIEEI